jgi:fatty acid desaturase
MEEPLPSASQPSESDQRFFPRGAIFFFGLLVVLYAAVWFIIYWLMIARA